MKRRHLLAGLAASTVMNLEAGPAHPANTYLELKTWRLHTTPENQATRLAAYLESGLAPALTRAGSKLVGAFSNVIGPDGPYYITLVEYDSLAAMSETLAKLKADEAHRAALTQLAAGSGLPFVRVESSLLRSFDGMPKATVAASANGGTRRVFEMRTYESQNFLTLERKVDMFNHGEMQIFERLGFRPVFFGETLVGPRQPNLTYMLSYDDLAARDRLWSAFVSDPAWKKLSAEPQLHDSEIVANISNVILQPLRFSPIQ